MSRRRPFAKAEPKAELRVTPSPAAAPRRRAEVWEERDRIGKMSIPSLRELRMRAILNGGQDADLVVDLTETLEDLILVAAELSDEHGCNMVAEELPDAMKRIGERKEEAVSEAEEDKQEWEADKAQLEERIRGIEEDHKSDVAGYCETIAELRRRAEKAEHVLVEAVRSGHSLDQDAAARMKELEDKLLRAESHAAGLEVMIERLRADRPTMKARRSK